MLWAVVVACPAYVLWRISDAYRFYQDDLLQFGVAQQSGLSWELLSLNVFQHFAPVNRLAHLFLVRVTDFSLWGGMLLSAGLVLLLLASLLWVLHELAASFPARLLALVAVGLSITVLDTAVWADAALHILPALVATNAVVAAHVRGVTTGHRRWHVLALALFAGGILTQERVLFALPLAVLVDVLLLGSGRSLRDRWQLLRSVLVPLAAMTVVALVGAVYIYVNYAAGSAAARPSLGVTGKVALGAFTEGIGPPWVGIRLDQLTSVPVQVAILAVALAVAAVLVWVRRSNADALAFFLAAFVLYYGFLAFSPILRAGMVDPTALRLHNGAYLLMPTVVAASRLRLRRVGPAGGTGTARAVRSRSPEWAPLVAAGLLAVLLVVMGGRFTERSWTLEREAHGYLDNLARSEPTWSDPEATLVPLLVPQTIARDWAAYYGRHEFFLRFHQPGWVPQELGERPVVIDAEGRPRPVQLVEEAVLEDAGPDACSAAGRRQLVGAGTVTGEPLFLRLSYRTSAETSVRATSSEGLTADAAPFGNWEVPLEPGAHTVLIPLHSTEVESVLVDWAGEGQQCVEAAAVVRPVFSDDDQCTGMDAFGARTGPSPCPARPAG